MGDMLLGDGAVAKAMKDLPLWQREGDAIRRSVKLPTFKEALSAVQAVGEAAEAMGHHPDIDIRYRTLTFTLTTHSAGGLTAKDFALAREIDGLLPS